MRQQPNSKHCFVCGLESPVGLGLHFFDNGSDEVRALYTVDGSYNGYPGVVHGGIIAAMLDEAGGRAAMIGNPDRFMMTATLNIHYRKPVPVNTQLLLVGRLMKDRGRTAQAHCEVRLPDGMVAAEADTTLVAIPAEYSQRETDLAALGWKVYPYDGPVPPSE
jgi:uncharacterized protein (TIGR00369 family)